MINLPANARGIRDIDHAGHAQRNLAPGCSEHSLLGWHPHPIVRQHPSGRHRSIVPNNASQKTTNTLHLAVKNRNVSFIEKNYRESLTPMPAYTQDRAAAIDCHRFSYFSSLEEKHTIQVRGVQLGLIEPPGVGHQRV
jgi:hypothetical protein